MARNYTAVSFARGETPPSTRDELDPAKHATLNGMILEMDRLALRLDKGLAVITAREEVGDITGADSARVFWNKLDDQWRDLYEQYDAILGPSKFGCIECCVKRGDNIDWSRVPLTARLCASHAQAFQVQRARLRWPQK